MVLAVYFLSRGQLFNSPPCNYCMRIIVITIFSIGVRMESIGENCKNASIKIRRVASWHSRVKSTPSVNQCGRVLASTLSCFPINISFSAFRSIHLFFTLHFQFLLLFSPFLALVMVFLLCNWAEWWQILAISSRPLAKVHF